MKFTKWKKSLSNIRYNLGYFLILSKNVYTYMILTLVLHALGWITLVGIFHPDTTTMLITLYLVISSIVLIVCRMINRSINIFSDPSIFETDSGNPLSRFIGGKYIYENFPKMHHLKSDLVRDMVHNGYGYTWRNGVSLSDLEEAFREVYAQSICNRKYIKYRYQLAKWIYGECRELGYSTYISSEMVSVAFGGIKSKFFDILLLNIILRTDNDVAIGKYNDLMSRMNGHNDKES